jgi:hypothetical protein
VNYLGIIRFISSLLGQFLYHLRINEIMENRGISGKEKESLL